MTDLILSYIRTYVPLAVGAVLAWVAVHWGIVVPESISAELTALLAAGLTAAYYGIVRALEQRWPWAGKLLGAARTVTYEKPAPPAAVALRRRMYG